MARSNQYGVQIGTCSYVSIIGGQISQVGTKAGNDGTANVCISGSPTRVVINGVNLSPTYEDANDGLGTGTTGSSASEYGLLISGSPSSVNVSGCTGIGVVSITGTPGVTTIDSCNGLTSLEITGSAGNLTVTNCAGYNDRNTPINTLTYITTGVAYAAATAGSHSGTSYYGPSFVMFTAGGIGSTFQVNGGAAQLMVSGQVVCLTLASPYDTIQFNVHAPAAFAWIGK
jgi:hypothetical protein